MGGVVVLLVVIVLVLWVLASCIRIVPQAYAVVLERLGAYKATWSTESISRFRSLSVLQEE